MNKLNDIIGFYRDCYQHDLKGIRITNFISKTSTKRLTPSDNEFFHDEIDKIHVDSEWGQDVEKTLLLDHKEKALYAGTHFIKGNKALLGNTSTNYIPLYIHELELVKIQEVYFVEVSDSYINPDFIELMNSMDEELKLSQDVFEQYLPDNPFGFENLLDIERFFKTRCPNWDVEDLNHYHDPNFNFLEQFTSLKKLKSGTKTVLPGLIIGIFKKPQGSLGVINELSILADNLDYSDLLNQFFGLSKIARSQILEKQVYIPASLSESQLNSIYKAHTSDMSMILGPPGTGKSFTIACLALDAICKNKSVLVISKNAQATRVISNIIEKQFGIKGKLVKADNQVYKRGLASRLSKMITWLKTPRGNVGSTFITMSEIFSNISLIIRNILVAEQREIEWGKFYHENNKGFFSIFKDKWIQYQKMGMDPVWKLNDSLIEKNREKNRIVKKYIKERLEARLYNTLQERRSSFVKLVNALGESNYTKLDEKISQIDFDLILKALPIWLTTTKQISRHLPLTRELFDFVIIDEASQCDVASLIPAIYRAKKLVVVGDPQQLNHISFLSDKKQQGLFSKYDIQNDLPDYRKDSVIDWANLVLESQDHVTFLDDHYRSEPAIIRFSNERFYDNQLNIIRSHPIRDRQQSVLIRNVHGVRDKQNKNRKEADAIINEVRRIVKEYEEVDKKVAPSIGITSPIRAQVSYLRTSIYKEFSTDVIRKHRILIGTPFHFQGEERDTMLISFAIDSAAHFASINYLNKEDVFNVLITRARNRQFIFTSVDPATLPKSSLLREYLEYDHSPPETDIPEDNYDSFLAEVSEYLMGRGYKKIYYSHNVSGVAVDLTVVHKDRFYCIDLIGYPGEFELQFTPRNIEMLNRMKTPVHFVTYSSWVLDEKTTKRDILKFLNSN